MTTRKLRSMTMSLALIVVLFSIPTLSPNAQQIQNGNGPQKTDSRMVYHGGPVMTFAPDVFFIWYGCWDDNCGFGGNTNTITQAILADFVSNVGGSPYFQINAGYPNGSGGAPSGALFYAGSAYDRYSHGLELTAADIADIAANQVQTNGLPQDPSGIYVVLASADVSSNLTGLCAPSALPHHGVFDALGSRFPYAFVGNPNRCPTVAAPQFFSNGVQLPTPNDNLAADAMANTLTNLLNVIVTNPQGGAWFDRYGLENGSKCVGKFGPTYSTPNGARANLRLGGHDYLIQQNWVIAKKEHCAMNSSL